MSWNKRLLLWTTCFEPGIQFSELFVSPYPLEMLLGARAGTGQSSGPLWEPRDYRRGPSCPHTRSSPLFMVLGITPSVCQEQAATWEERLADSLGVVSSCQANSPHPGTDSMKKYPDVWSRSKSHPWLSLMHTLHGSSLKPMCTPTL